MSYDKRLPKAWEAIKKLQTDLGTKVEKNGDTMFGPLKFANHGGGNAICNGNGDGSGFEINNLKLTSWYGIGFSPSVGGMPVPMDQYSHYFDTRNGDMGIRGKIKMNNGMHFYADEGGTGVADTSGNGKFWVDNAGNAGVQGNLTVRGDKIALRGDVMLASDGNLYMQTNGYNDWLSNILTSKISKANSAENTILHKPQGGNQLYVNNSGNNGWNALALDYSSPSGGVFNIGSLKVRTGNCMYKHGQTNTTITFPEGFSTGCISVMLIPRYVGGSWDTVAYSLEGFNNVGFWFRCTPAWDIMFTYVAIGF